MNVLEHSSRRVLMIAAVLVLFASLSLLAPPRTASASSTSSTGVLVPLYTYPGSVWSDLLSAKHSFPTIPMIAIINPNNGPGSYQDPTILNGVRQLQAAGITVVGYVYTQYAARSVGSVESDIYNYKQLYGLSGVFFDQMSNVPGEESYYSTLTSYTHSLGMYLTVGNPGTGVPNSFISTVDLLNIYENAGLPSLSVIAQRTSGASPSHFSITPYAVGSISQSYVQSAANYVGYMYISSGQYPNQWNYLPPYFSTFLSYLGTGGGVGGGNIPLTVNTVSSSGSSIGGLYTVVETGSGSIVDTGFSPLSYNVQSGGTYVVSVSNYGNYVFSHWSNGDTSNSITITPTSATTLTAYYTTGSGGGGGGGQVPLTITSVDLNGNPVQGLRTIVETSSGTVVDAGFTPMTFEATQGNTYTVTVDNYGSYQFDHWSTGSTSRTITVTANSATTLVAYYKTSSSSGASITVESSGPSGMFQGMWMVVRSSSGAVLKTGFTNFVFNLPAGSTVTLTASNYGSMVFSHWSNGSTSRTITISGSSSTTLIAYYS